MNLLAVAQQINARPSEVKVIHQRPASLNLFRSSNQPSFGMLVLSKRVDALAQEAIRQAIQLDEQEASATSVRFHLGQDPVQCSARGVLSVKTGRRLL